MGQVTILQNHSTVGTECKYVECIFLSASEWVCTKGLKRWEKSFFNLIILHFIKQTFSNYLIFSKPQFYILFGSQLIDLDVINPLSKLI